MSVLAIEIPYWGQSLLRVLGGIVAVLLPAGTIVYVFLFKMMSFMQSRLGPMEAGPYGSLQLVAEVGKWLQKEDIAPEKADHVIFKMAPVIVLTSTFLLVAVVPFGPDAWFTNFEAGAFYTMAVGSVSVIGILIAGYAQRQQVLVPRRPPRRRPADRLRAADGAGDRGCRHPGRFDEPPGDRRRPEHRRDLRLERRRVPVRPHPVRRLRHLHDLGPGRADTGAVRHADRRVRAGRRLHDRVLGVPLPDLLHR